MNRKITASLLILAAVLANVAFTALGSIFNYPDVLDEPAGEVLTAFRDHQGAVSGWFSVLALSAALLAPIAIGVGRLSSARAMRLAVPIGVTAAVVQVVGLLRWPILVPGYSSDAAGADAGVAAGARDSFTTAGDILGTAIPTRTAMRIARDPERRPTPIATGASSAAESARTVNHPLTALSLSRNAASTSPAGSSSTSG